MNPSLCPFFQSDFERIRQELFDMPLQKLITVTEDIMDQLSPVENLNYNINKFCHAFEDKHGRIEFVRKLIDDGIIVGLQFPDNFYNNPRMVDMLTPQGYAMQFPFGDSTSTTGDTALTDDLEVVSGPVTIKNPRWEHKDSAKKEKSPDKVAFGDTVMLMADVSGVPEGCSVTFDIYDISENPPMVAANAKGKNEKGIAKGEWVVTDKSGKGAEAKLAFEGIVKSKASERAEIGLLPPGEVLDVYLENKDGQKIEKTSPKQNVFLVVETKNMVGSKIDVDLSDTEIDFEFKGEVLANDILTGLEILEDTMKIELKTIKGR